MHAILVFLQHSFSINGTNKYTPNRNPFFVTVLLLKRFVTIQLKSKNMTIIPIYLSKTHFILLIYFQGSKQRMQCILLFTVARFDIVHKDIKTQEKSIRKEEPIKYYFTTNRQNKYKKTTGGQQYPYLVCQHLRWRGLGMWGRLGRWMRWW